MTIKASAVLQRVIKLGTESPDETRSCQYFSVKGDPCCIVGNALGELGVDPAPFLADEDLNKYTDVYELFRDHAEQLDLVDDLPEDGMKSLRRVQKVQDQGEAWGRAILTVA